MNQIFTVKISQDSSAPYLVSELENTIGSVSYERITEGKFRLVCIGAFPDERKVLGLREFHFMDGGGKYRVYRDDEAENPEDSLIIETYGANGELSDNQLSSTELQIVVFPPDV